MVTIQKLLDGVSHELQLHQSYAAKWDLTAKEINDPSPATKAYTDFLLAVADDPKVILLGRKFHGSSSCRVVCSLSRGDCNLGRRCERRMINGEACGGVAEFRFQHFSSISKQISNLVKSNSHRFVTCLCVCAPCPPPFAEQCC